MEYESPGQRQDWITDRPMIVHNIGAGPTLEDMLFNYPITGHDRYEHKHPIPPTSPNH